MLPCGLHFYPASSVNPSVCMRGRCLVRTARSKYLNPLTCPLLAGDRVLYRATGQRALVLRAGPRGVELEGGAVVPREDLELAGWSAGSALYRPVWTPCHVPRRASTYPEMTPAQLGQHLHEASRLCVQWLHAIFTDCSTHHASTPVETLLQHEAIEWTHRLHLYPRHAREVQWLRDLTLQWLDGLGKSAGTGYIGLALLVGRLYRATSPPFGPVPTLAKHWRAAGLSPPEMVWGMLRAQLTIGGALTLTLCGCLRDYARVAPRHHEVLAREANATLEWMARGQWERAHADQGDALGEWVRRYQPPLSGAYAPLVRGVARIFLALFLLSVPPAHVHADPAPSRLFLRLRNSESAMRNLDHMFTLHPECSAKA